MNYSKQLIFAVVSLVSIATSVSAQQTVDNSIYSRYGIGDILNSETLQSAAQGGTSTTWAANNALNSGNPAALGALDFTEYSIGLFAKYGVLRTATQQGESFATNINHLSLAFPIFNPINEIGVKKKRAWKWGIGVGLRPLSQVAYAVENISQDPVIGTIRRQYEGSGGTYQLGIDNGFKWKGISAGVSAQYLFGRALYLRTMSFQDSTAIFGNVGAPSGLIYEDDIVYSGLGIKFGGQYEYILTKRGTETPEDFRRKDKVRTIAGATYAPSYKVAATNGFSRVRTAIDLTTGLEEIASGSSTGTMTMPSAVSFGLRFLKDNHWQVSAQYDAKNWSEYSNTERPEVLANTYALRVGGEWTPNYKSFTDYWSRVSYRLGGFTATDPRVINGEQLQSRAVTMGLGMPIRLPRGMLSHCNINVELGEQGSSKFNEFYTRLTLGFTLNDQLWFARPKYN